VCVFSGKEVSQGTCGKNFLKGKTSHMGNVKLVSLYGPTFVF
jgi:hypothetical protein